MIERARAAWVARALGLYGRWPTWRDPAMQGRWTLRPIDCRDAMRAMAADSIDSIVTDPPYHLTSIVKRFGSSGAAPAQFGTDGAYARASAGFMGQQWDGGDVAFDPETWRLAWRVLKPGGHLLAFSGTRTYHRMVCAIEDAGFEIRDQIGWVFGSGFPKSHDVSKGIDRLLGAEREITPASLMAVGSEIGKISRNLRCDICGKPRASSNPCRCPRNSGPVTGTAHKWEGWGTALKPAWEPICVARKPLVGTVAGNVLAHGTGALNIDACRIKVNDRSYAANCSGDRDHAGNRSRDMDFALGCGKAFDLGRWPANIIHDGSDEVIMAFPTTKSIGHHPAVRGAGGIGTAGHNGQEDLTERYGDTGSAARFFYCAKASKADREAGLEGLPMRSSDMVSDHSGQHITRREEGYEAPKRANHHPTVKPRDLMRYLCRLVTPPGGLVFDPFAGSGSTGVAALLEGFRFIGCEMTPEYIPIAEARLRHAEKESTS